MDQTAAHVWGEMETPTALIEQQAVGRSRLAPWLAPWLESLRSERSEAILMERARERLREPARRASAQPKRPAPFSL